MGAVMFVEVQPAKVVSVMAMTVAFKTKMPSVPMATKMASTVAVMVSSGNQLDVTFQSAKVAVRLCIGGRFVC
ncbi:MAG: hypothetical protein NPINA01_17410 [Nitrospinaceae bacterium]|nr:MAG: hypothetical protein NPINA01_17410 [Nitrospinaceae bacterium]